MNAYGLILAGGRSQRLFPFSRPKPLLESSGSTLLDEALNRFSSLKKCFVVTTEPVHSEFEAYFAEKKIKPEFLVEPEARDTAAAVGFALRELKSERPDWVAIASADQFIEPRFNFSEFLKIIESEIEKHPGSLFVAGSLPELEAKEKELEKFGWMVAEENSSGPSWSVSEFVEKPQGDQLTELKIRGGMINAGMFYGRYDTFVAAYEKFYPEVLNSQTSYSSLKREPIDRAIIEKHSDVRAFRAAFAWKDLGTWEAIHRHLGGMSHGSLAGADNFVWKEDDFEVYAFDVEGLSIVQSGKRILVMPTEKTGQLKEYLSELEAQRVSK